MATKTKKKPSKKLIQKIVEPEKVQINLNNVFPYIVSTLDNLNRKIDRLQMTVDAVGIAVAEKNNG